MPIDFNTPNPKKQDRAELPNGVPSEVLFTVAQPPSVISAMSAAVLSISLVLSGVSLLFSYKNIVHMSAKSPIVIQCDPSVQQDLKEINLKMQQINKDIWGK